MARAADRARRLYEEVTGRDRFRLAVELAVRGQESEFEQIVRTAPTVYGTHLDLAMCDAFEELRSLSHEFDASTRHMFGCLLVLDVMRGQFEQVAATGCGDLEVYSVPMLLELLDQIGSVVEQRLRMLEAAVGELGRDRLGLEPASLLASQPPWVQAAFLRHRERIDEAPLDPEELAGVREGLLVGWGPEGFGKLPSRGEEH